MTTPITRFIAAATAMDNGLSAYDAVGVAEMTREDLIAYAAWLTGAYHEQLSDLYSDALNGLLQKAALEEAL